MQIGGGVEVRPAYYDRNSLPIGDSYTNTIALGDDGDQVLYTAPVERIAIVNDLGWCVYHETLATSYHRYLVRYRVYDGNDVEQCAMALMKPTDLAANSHSEGKANPGWIIRPEWYLTVQFYLWSGAAIDSRVGSWFSGVEFDL